MFARGLCLAVVGLAAIAPIHGSSAAVIDAWTIDGFFTTQEVNVAGAAPPNQFGFSSVTAAGVIGGERDLQVIKTQGADGERVRARVNPLGSNLLRMTIDEANGLVQVVWDGIDGSSALNPFGLGGIDLSAGLLNPFFELNLTFSDVGGPIVLEVFQQGSITNFAQAVLSAPGGIASGSSILLTQAFSDFIAFGTSSLDAIFRNVGAIAMTIDARATAQEGWDMRLDYIKTRGTAQVALPGSLALAMVGLVLLRRRVTR